MTRKDKALLSKDNREVNGDIETQYSDGSWHSCCPYYIDCGESNMDEDTRIGEYGAITGCGGITCIECWSKEL